MDWSQQHKEEWSLLVGKVMLSFSDIEYVTYNCLAVLPSEKIAESLAHLRLGQRIDLLNAVIDSRNLGEEGDRFKRLLLSAKDAAQSRNLIAHNPLALKVYADDEGAIEYRHVIASLKNENKLFDKKQLTEFAESTEMLATELMEAWATLGKRIEGEQA